MGRCGLRMTMWLATVGLALMAGMALSAQQAQPPLVQPSALKQGRLVVWVVHPASAPIPAPTDYGGAARKPPGYNEQTAGSFGQPASTMGQNAGSVGVSTDSPQIARTNQAPTPVAPADRDAAAAAAAGYHEQTASSFGQSASTFGTEASNHGQSPSTVGQSASNTGTNASNYGQTASSFGDSLSTVAQAGQPAVPEAPRGVEAVVEPKLRTAYPDLTVQFVSVDVDKLGAQLRTAAASPAMAGVYPDVLVFEGFPASWDALPASAQRVVKVTFGGSAPMKNAPAGLLAARRVVVTIRSRHQTTAVAFAEYLQNQGLLKVTPAGTK